MSNWTIRHDESLREFNLQIARALAARGDVLLARGDCNAAIRDYASAGEHGLEDMPGLENARMAVYRFLRNLDAQPGEAKCVIDGPCHLVAGADEYIIAIFDDTEAGRDEAIDYANALARDEFSQSGLFSANLVTLDQAFAVTVYHYDGTRVTPLHVATPCWETIVDN